jgi:hypothetical protein
MKNVNYALPPDDVKLKSIDQVLNANSVYEQLIKYVLENLGDINDKDIYYDIQNIIENGAGGGFGNYIYYSDMINWLEKDRHLQYLISKYFKNWAEEIYQVDEDFSYLIKEYNLLDEDDMYDDIYWDNLTYDNLFNLTYLVCKSSPYFKSYNDKDLVTSVYQIYLYMNNKRPALEGSEATFISWFVLEGVCYMFDK